MRIAKTLQLAVAGADGTLAQRMAGTVAERYVRGKTGTLNKVTLVKMGIVLTDKQKAM